MCLRWVLVFVVGCSDESCSVLWWMEILVSGRVTVEDAEGLYTLERDSCPAELQVDTRYRLDLLSSLSRHN